MSTKPARKKDVALRPSQVLDSMGDEKIIARIMDGETLTGIAKSLGMSRHAMVDWLNSEPDRSARARDARRQSAAAFDEQITGLLEGASDPFALAKARELAHHLRWRASKIDPSGYGEKLEMNLQVGIGDRFRQAEEQLKAIDDAR